MIGKAELERQELKGLLEQEFFLSTDGWSEEDYQRAEEALTAFESVEAFLISTDWERDNPELGGEDYLTGNRICRWVNGKFFYFSRLLWEEGR